MIDIILHLGNEERILLNVGDLEKNKKIFSSKWNGLHPSALYDVFTLHKMHCFAFQQKTDYTDFKFIKQVQTADEAIFDKVGLMDFVNTAGFKERLSTTSFYPYWLCNDDIFQVIPLFFGVNKFVKTLMDSASNNIYKVRSFIIPKNGTTSIYDEDREFNGQFMISKSIDVFMRGKHVKHIGSVSMTETINDEKVNEFADLVADRIQNVANVIGSDDSEQEIIILFDRRALGNSEYQKIWVFKCADFEPLQSLKTSNLIGFDYHFGDDEATRCYLNFGVRQRVRFYPEFITSFLPRLFVASSDMNRMRFLEKLYSDNFKKGWTLDLSDSDFNQIYKAITGYNHETNNYRREKAGNEVTDEKQRRFGFLQYAEHQMKDSVAWTHLRAYTEKHGFDSDGLFDDLLPELDTVQQTGEVDGKR